MDYTLLMDKSGDIEFKKAKFKVRGDYGLRVVNG